MPNPIRVLMADDSAAVRRLVTETLSKAADIEVVGAARDGRDALEMISQVRPDVILLDVEMPVLDGIDTLKIIRETDKRTPVLMFSSLTVSGGEATLEALALGANDFVSKPTASGHISQAIDYINATMLPKIRQWTMQSSNVGGMEKLKPIKAAQNHSSQISVVAIGSSTGGPIALAEIVAKLPDRLGVPILIAQHMPAVFTKLLAERLNKVCALNIVEATNGAIVRPNEIVIAPGDFHMTVVNQGAGQRIALNQNPPENSCRPSVDVLFRSVSAVYGKRTLAVVLTGMGKDGVEGCRVLSEKGASIIAQDQASSVVWGMPRAVAEEGLADRVLPLDRIHSEIAKRAGRKLSPVTN